MGNQVASKYFESVDRFSSEHLNDIAMLRELQKKMASSSRGEDAVKKARSFHDTIDRLNSFIEKNHVMLTHEESQELHEISHAKLAPEVIKRLLEDFYHKLNLRVTEQKAERQREDNLAGEIAEIRYGSGVLDWFRLLLFSIRNNTITPFSHQYRHETLILLTARLYERVNLLVKNIMPLLNKNYYLMSTLEYNSMVLLIQMKETLEALRNVPSRESYKADSISHEMDQCALIFAKIFTNRNFIRETFTRIMKGHQHDHGLWGTLNHVLDKKVQEKRLIDHSYESFFPCTSTGAIVSYYTCRQRVVIRTLNQVLYLLDQSGAIEQERKLLTPAAREREEQEHTKTKTMDSELINKLDELDRIVEHFLKRGPELAERIIRHHAGSSYRTLAKELETRPILWLSRLNDGFNRYFLELLLDIESRIFIYDGNEYQVPVDNMKKILEYAGALFSENQNLSGGRFREVLNLRQPSDSTREKFFTMLIQSDALDNMMTNSLKLAKSMVRDMVNRYHSLAIAVNDIVSSYERDKMVSGSKVHQEYGFYSRAIIRDSDLSATARVLETEGVTLKSFMEAIAAVSFYITSLCSHEGIQALQGERKKIKQQIEEKRKAEADTQDSSPESAEEIRTSSIIEDELNRIYRDSLTGVWNFEYFTDQVVPRYYDENGCYTETGNRYFLLVTVDNIQSINNTYDYNNGDLVMTGVAGILSGILENSAVEESALYRHEGGAFLCVINGPDQSLILDLFMQASKQVNQSDFNSPDIDPGLVTVSAGLYREQTMTNYNFNLKVTRALAHVARKTGGDRIVFIKDPNHIVTDRDWVRDDEINETILGIIT